jgi:hypothetical protein
MTKRAQLRQPLLLAAMVATAFSRNLAATDCSLADTRFATSYGDVFSLTYTGFTSAEIQTSVNYWSCTGYSDHIPTFQLGGSSGVPVSIVKVEGNSTAPGGGCGRTVYPGTTNGGTVSSVEITIWTNENDGDSCAPLTDTLAHELGHVLLLTDAPDASCNGHIMGRRNEGGTRTVFADDCAVADYMWETPQETQPSDPWCSAYCWTDCVNNVCPGIHPDTGCPLLIDVENDGIHLTGLKDPVWFDIDADGDVELMSWTDQGEGLLALDRNGNGSIDDGGELFGDATVLANGVRAANGYLALAELDSWAFGGNGDGQIDADDAGFGSLRLWVDEDHSGTSRPGELLTLSAAGIRKIGLDYRMSRRTDSHGNDFRFLGRAWKEGRRGVVRPVLTWDVFFLVVD